jgi:hypothetical protein
MSRRNKITLVALIVIVEFLFIAMFCNPYPHGMIGDVRYRHAERFVALQEYLLHKSPDTRAGLDRELALMHRHEDWKMYLAVGLLVVTNVALIYFVLRNQQRVKPS